MGVRRSEYGRPITATPVGLLEVEVGPVGIDGYGAACIRNRDHRRGFPRMNPAGFISQSG